VEIDGVRRVTRCDHKGSREVESREVGAVREPPVLPVDPKFRARLCQEEKTILDLILARRGQAKAIRIREIIDIIWPQAVAAPRDFQDEQDCQREVKRVVARCRDEADIPIASAKEPPYGYFIAVTQRERQNCHDRLLQEGWELIKRSQVFVRDEFLAEWLTAKAIEL
jgi:hypothetical protein